MTATPKPPRCRAKKCNRFQTIGELCTPHAEQHAKDPASIVWKKGAPNTIRDDAGLWVTKLDVPVVDGVGNEVTVTELVCRALRAGATLQSAASYAGIAESTLWDWLKNGRRADGDTPQRAFAFAVDKALAECVVGAVAKISDADDWRAHAWLLERRFPSDFGQVTRTEIGNADGQPFRTEGVQRLSLDGLSLDDKVALLALLDKADAGDVVDAADVIELDERRAISQ